MSRSAEDIARAAEAAVRSAETGAVDPVALARSVQAPTEDVVLVLSRDSRFSRCAPPTGGYWWWTLSIGQPGVTRRAKYATPAGHACYWNAPLPEKVAAALAKRGPMTAEAIAQSIPANLDEVRDVLMRRSTKWRVQSRASDVVVYEPAGTSYAVNNGTWEAESAKRMSERDAIREVV